MINLYLYFGEDFHTGWTKSPAPPFQFMFSLKLWRFSKVVSFDLGALRKFQPSIPIYSEVTGVMPGAVGAGILDHPIYNNGQSWEMGTYPHYNV